MNITIQPTLPIEKEKLKNLYSLYLHDLSQYDKKVTISENGLYELTGLDVIFKNDDLKPYFIFADNKLVGFLLLTGAAFAPEDSQWGIEDIFIVRNKRRKQVATHAIKLIMEQHKGKYCIFQFQKNNSARKFWHNFYIQNNIEYKEMERMEGGHICAVQNFNI